MKTKIRLFKAEHGDCILIQSFNEEGNPFNILVDGGTRGAFEDNIYHELILLKTIDLLVLTHIDDDHIGGFLYFFESCDFSELQIKNIWFNALNLLRVDSGLQINAGQGKKLEKLLLEKGVNMNVISPKIDTETGIVQLHDNISATILSPTPDILKKLMNRWPKIPKEELIELNNNVSAVRAKSQVTKGTLEALSHEKFKHSKSINQDVVNASSIAFVLTLPDMKILLLGDARDELIREQLENLNYSEENSLEVDYVKISHHGSKNNTSCEFLDMIKCENFIISTNGGKGKTKHPNRELIARLANHKRRDKSIKRTIYLNYPKEGPDGIEFKAGTFITEKETQDYNLDLIFNTELLP